MNYWLLTTEYPPFFGGGISTYCYHTACMLSDEGHRVTVFINDKTVRSFTTENRVEARIIRFNPNLTNADSFLGNITALSFEFANIVKLFIEKEGPPDILEAQDYQGIAYFILQFKYCLFGWCKNIPIIITMHSPSFLYMEYNQLPIYKKPNFWVGEMERFSVQAADLLISPSEYLVEELKKRFTISNTNLHVVANPYKLPEVVSDKKDIQVLNNQLTYYGKLSPQKGSFKILEEFETLWKKGFDQSFTMVGDQNIYFSPLKKTMGVIIKNQYSEYIKKDLLKFKNKITPAEMSDVLANSLIIIIPSIVDNLPYTVLEMMARGKIVIVSKQGGQHEVILQGQDGFVFDYTVPGSFDAILNKVLALSPEDRTTICKKAILKISENYSYKTIYSQKIKLIKQLLHKQYIIPTQFPFIRTLTKVSPERIDTNSEKGKLSVIVPYYNLGKYINETIDSIFNSSYNNIEILIINDGSSDFASIEALKKYKGQNKIKVIDKNNSGLADTRNVGAQMAKGEFLAFLDADDTIEKTYYEKAIKLLSHYTNVHFVGAWTNYFGASKNTWPTFNPEPPLILTHNMINSSSLVYKKNSFLNSGKNDPVFKIGLEDYDSVLSMLSDGLNGVAIPEALFNYRVRNKSMVRSVTPEIRKDYYEKMTNKHQGLYAQFKETIDQLIKENGPPLHTDNSTLDNMPFQNIPLLNFIYKKCYYFAKSNPAIKNMVLSLKARIS